MTAQYDEHGGFIGHGSFPADHRPRGKQSARCGNCHEQRCAVDWPCNCCVPVSSLACTHCGGTGLQPR